MSLLTDGKITVEDVKIAIGWLSEVLPEQKITLDYCAYRTYKYELHIEGITGAIYAGSKKEIYEHIRAMLTGIEVYKKFNTPSS
jgi:hypothetical protein